jgi:hypothetical protein
LFLIDYLEWIIITVNTFLFCMYSSPCPLLLQAKEGDEKALPLFAQQRGVGVST